MLSCDEDHSSSEKFPALMIKSEIIRMCDRLRGRVARPHELTVVTVGDSKVGKTALINRFCDDVFIEVCYNQIDTK